MGVGSWAKAGLCIPAQVVRPQSQAVPLAEAVIPARPVQEPVLRGWRVDLSQGRGAESESLGGESGARSKLGGGRGSRKALPSLVTPFPVRCNP